VAGYCKQGNELTDSIKGEKFHDNLSDYQMLRMCRIYTI
jgi:hypothetical protein